LTAATWKKYSVRIIAGKTKSIGTHSEGRNRQRALGYYFQGLQLSEIARRLGLSRQRVYQIVRPAPWVDNRVRSKAESKCQDCNVALRAGHVHDNIRLGGFMKRLLATLTLLFLASTARADTFTYALTPVNPANFYESFTYTSPVLITTQTIVPVSDLDSFFCYGCFALPTALIFTPDTIAYYTSGNDLGPYAADSIFFGTQPGALREDFFDGGFDTLGAHATSEGSGWPGTLTVTDNPTPVPEPGTLVLLPTGLCALWARLRRVRGIK